MKKIIYSENINSNIKLVNAKLKHDKRKAKIPCNYRLYTINNKDYTCKGYWIDNGKIFKDRIKFIKYHSYITAKKDAIKILNSSNELCIAIENITKNILYIVYKEKTQVLKIKRVFIAYDARQAVKYARHLLGLNGGASIEFKSGIYKITSYK